MGKRVRKLFAAKPPARFGFAVSLGTEPPKQGQPQPNPRWIHIANEGVYDGYPGGGVEISTSTFEQIVRNFKADPRYKAGANGLGEGKVVPFDFGHVSEMDPRIGDPAANEAAAAWVMDLKVERGANGKAQLWGWTLLGDEVKAMIEKGAITYVSIAYQPNAVHPVSGADIGALMTSVAFTNKPFIRDLTPLAASDFAAYLHSHPEAVSMLADALTKKATQERPTMTFDFKKLCKAFGVNPAAEDAEEAVVSMAGEALVMKRGLADILKATGFTDLADLVKNIPDLLKAKEKLASVQKELDVALKALAGFEDQIAEGEVAAAMRVHEIPEKCQGLMLSAFKADKEQFRKDYPIPDKDRKHLLSTFAAGAGGEQTETPKPKTLRADGNRDDGGGDKIDLRAFTGNITQKVIAHLKSKDPGFEKLSWQEQCRRAANFRQQNAANIIAA